MTRLGKVRVLVVDGDKERVELFQRCLSSEFEIVEASPGPVATRLLETEEFDMLISEQGMMRLGGQSKSVAVVASCPSMKSLLASIERIARAEGDVFFSGESGSGKTFFARSLHRAEGRQGDFVCVRLADLSPPEMESALFGQALPEAGTLVLDGIEHLPLTMQERLVRERRSGQLPSRGCRLICASVHSLDHESISSSLAEHLRPLRLSVPALRDRGEDIPHLAVQFVGEASRRLGRTGLSLGREAMAVLCAHEWPGNVGELHETIEKAVARTGDDTEIGPDLLLAEQSSPIIERVVDNIIGGCRGLDAAMAELEAAVIREALQQQRGNRSAAARQLKLPRQTLQDRMKKHGLWSV